MNDAIEIVSIRATVRVPLPRREAKFERKLEAAGEARTIDAYSFERAARMPFQVVSRNAIDGTLKGPAIITEGTTTTYLDAEWSARIGNSGEMIMERGI
ncbi:hypothetical protein D9M69_701070 [compost metagenome]